MTKRPYRRRKPVSCVLCDEETYDPDKVCSTCRRVYALGVSYYRLSEEGKEPEQVPVSVCTYWRLYAWDAKAEDVGRHNDRDLERELKTILLTMANAESVVDHHYFGFRSPVEFIVGQAYREDGQLKDSMSGSNSSSFLLSREAASQLQRLVEIVRALRQIDKNEAKEKAERFVFAMAKGEVDLDKISSAYPMKEE